MGSFSFTYAKINKKESFVTNMQEDDNVIMLLPQEFGISNIIGTYADYGRIRMVNGLEVDIFAMLAAMHDNTLMSEFKALLAGNQALTDWNNKNRDMGLDMYYRQYPEHIGSKLRNVMNYQIKLLPQTEENEERTYEDVYGFSVSDPNQGCGERSYKVFQNDTHVFILNKDLAVSGISTEIEEIKRAAKKIENSRYVEYAILDVTFAMSKKVAISQRVSYKNTFEKFMSEDEINFHFNSELGKKMDDMSIEVAIEFINNYITKLEKVRDDIAK